MIAEKNTWRNSAIILDISWGVLVVSHLLDFNLLHLLESNHIQISSVSAAPQCSPKERKQTFLSLEEDSTSSLPLQDAAHVPLTRLPQHWKVR